MMFISSITLAIAFEHTRFVERQLKEGKRYKNLKDFFKQEKHGKLYAIIIAIGVLAFIPYLFITDLMITKWMLAVPIFFSFMIVVLLFISSLNILTIKSKDSKKQSNEGEELKSHENTN